ncbi:competence protein ComEC [Croceivirga lutea]|uniref:ComEC/Rec2 family competence protein n=1 Tax=Croceivirga lutea TaxID=1775167 RepID=UPI001639E076|nr:ComEC/Rec2 family competence protein [Croceivirga lutea]GGG35914.1 competence protein ComEC [Croceivirga lutea]
MPAFNFISVKLALCLIIGILLGFYFPIKIHLLVVVLLCLLLLLLVLLIKKSATLNVGFGVIAAFLMIGIGMLSVGLANPIFKSNHILNNTSNQPHIWQGKVITTLKPSSFSNRLVASVSYQDSTKVVGKILVNYPLEIDSIKIDHELVFFTEILPVNPPLNPHQFNYKSYLEKQGIYHQVYLKNEDLLAISIKSRSLKGIANSFRTQLIKNLRKYNFSDDEFGVIQALLLGKRDEISDETYTNYQKAGAVHILAVSGLHIGILLFILQYVLTPLTYLPKGKQLRTLLVVIILWGFAFLAGLSPSVVRAVTMFSFIAYAMNLNRPTNTFNIIALSIFFILLLNPLFLFQVGFQMSYAAVIAIVWIYPKLQRLWYPKPLLIRKLWQLLSVSFAAQLGVLPLSLFYFHQFPALFFVSNLLIVPFLGIILGLGILVLFLSSFNSLPDLVATGYSYLIFGMNTIVAWVAQQEAFVFRAISFDSVQLLLSYLILCYLLSTSVKHNYKKLVLTLSLIVIFIGWGIYLKHQASIKSEVILLHQSRKTILLHRNGLELQVLSSKTNELNATITNYKIAERISKISTKSLKNSYAITKKTIYRIDSSGVYSANFKTDYLLLTDSPKVNLNRVLNILEPRVVIADGSNYKTYIKRWQKSCMDKKIPFHYTGEKGAYYFEQ